MDIKRTEKSVRLDARVAHIAATADEDSVVLIDQAAIDADPLWMTKEAAVSLREFLTAAMVEFGWSNDR